MPSRSLTVGKLTAWIVLSLAIANVAQVIATALGRHEGREWIADCVTGSRDIGEMGPGKAIGDIDRDGNRQGEESPAP